MLRVAVSPPLPSRRILPDMIQQTLTKEPTEIQAGDSIAWTRSLLDFPASAGWVLKYAFRGPEAADFEAVASGDDHLLDLDSTKTALAPGEYTVQGYVAKGAERKTVFSGRVQVLPDLVATGAGYDPRSFAVRTLAAIEAVLAGTATRSQKKQKFEDTELEYFTLRELLEARTRLRLEVKREREVEARKQGKPSRRIVRTISRGN